MAVDIGAMLDRVVDEVFGDDYRCELEPHNKEPWIHSYLISTREGVRRSVRITATYEWYEAWIPELNVSSMLFEYDDVESEKETVLRWLCDAMSHYLDGEGQVTQRKTRFRRRLENVLRLDANGGEWVLGQSHGYEPYPD